MTEAADELARFLDEAPSDTVLVARLRRRHGYAGYESIIAAHLLTVHRRPTDEVLELRGAALLEAHRALRHDEGAHR